MQSGGETYSIKEEFGPTKVPEPPAKGTTEDSRGEAARTKVSARRTVRLFGEWGYPPGESGYRMFNLAATSSLWPFPIGI